MTDDLAATPTTGFRVYIDAEIHDPTDPGLVLEQVVEGDYNDRAVALARACEVSRNERTLAMVYDLSRPSVVVQGARLLIAGFDNGKPLQ